MRIRDFLKSINVDIDEDTLNPDVKLLVALSDYSHKKQKEEFAKLSPEERWEIIKGNPIYNN